MSFYPNEERILPLILAQRTRKFEHFSGMGFCNPLAWQILTKLHCFLRLSVLWGECKCAMKFKLCKRLLEREHLFFIRRNYLSLLQDFITIIYYAISNKAPEKIVISFLAVCYWLYVLIMSRTRCSHCLLLLEKYKYMPKRPN